MGIVKKAVGKIVKDVSVSYVVDGAIKAVDATQKAITGMGDFIDNHKVKADAKEKEKGIIRLAKAAREYEDMQYFDVEAELLAYGFTDITMLPRKDLNNVFRKKKKDGKVMEISIGGRNKFGEKSKFKADDKVIIIYHSL